MSMEAPQTAWIRERDAVVGRLLEGGGHPGVADPTLRRGKTGLELSRWSPALTNGWSAAVC